MRLETVALDDPSERGCCLFGTIRIQFNTVSPRACVIQKRRECQAFADARVQGREWLAGKAQEISDSFRFIERQRVVIAANFGVEAGHARTPILFDSKCKPATEMT